MSNIIHASTVPVVKTITEDNVSTPTSVTTTTILGVEDGQLLSAGNVLIATGETDPGEFLNMSVVDALERAHVSPVIIWKKHGVL